eukprot:2241762-Rhodomonas_salina.1
MAEVLPKVTRLRASMEANLGCSRGVRARQLSHRTRLACNSPPPLQVSCSTAEWCAVFRVRYCLIIIIIIIIVVIIMSRVPSPLLPSRPSFLPLASYFQPSLPPSLPPYLSPSLPSKPPALP